MSLNSLRESELDIPKSKSFYTPFDDLSTAEQNVELGEADLHPIVGGASEYDIRIFENRTIGITVEAQQIVYKVVNLLYCYKQRARIMIDIMLG